MSLQNTSEKNLACKIVFLYFVMPLAIYISWEFPSENNKKAVIPSKE